MNLAENLKKIRKENNLSQEELAEKLGVSRQSVSKWESNSAYPEMDKLIQISNMFNIGIDELLNKDIGEVREEKQSKINLQKTIDGFLDFITKSVDMFINMKFRQKIKFIFEEIVIAFVLLGLFLLLGCIGSTVCYSLFGFLGFSIYSKIYDFFEAIFIIIYLAFSIVIMLHIYKTRYLDYYVIVDKEEGQNPEEISKKIENNFIQNKHEKIIIRDANHSISRFFSILIKAFLILIKINLALLLLGLSFILVCFVIGFILSFSIVKTGLFFFGLFISIISSCLILILFMNLVFNFIINKKTKYKHVFIIFIGCLILLGSGIGSSLLGFSTFKIKKDTSEKYEMVIPMNNDLVFNEIGRDKVKFVESSNDDLKIVVNYSKNCKIKYFYGDNNKSLLHFYLVDDTNTFDYIRKKVAEFNDKRIVDSDYFEIIVYTSAENITKLEENYINWTRF